MPVKVSSGAGTREGPAPATSALTVTVQVAQPGSCPSPSWNWSCPTWDGLTGLRRSVLCHTKRCPAAQLWQAQSPGVTFRARPSFLPGLNLAASRMPGCVWGAHPSRQPPLHCAVPQAAPLPSPRLCDTVSNSACRASVGGGRERGETSGDLEDRCLGGDEEWKY